MGFSPHSWIQATFSKKFNSDNELQEEVVMCFRGQAADVCDSGIQKLFPRLNKYLDSAGDYVEKECYVQAIHWQCRFRKLKRFYIYKTFVFLLSGHASCIIVSVTCSGLIELILSSSWHIYRVICCDFDTLRYSVFPKSDAMAVRFGCHLEPVILELNMCNV
jgi:hypothetical protein